MIPHPATKLALISRRVTFYDSTVRPGSRYDLWDFPELQTAREARYQVIYYDGGVEATRHKLDGYSEKQARDEFERLVERHYDAYRDI